MELTKIENFRLIERNKAAADIYFDYNGRTAKAEFLFYLQGNACLGIRVGRHDNIATTKDFEEYINNHRQELKKRVQPDVVRVKQERLARLTKLAEE